MSDKLDRDKYLSADEFADLLRATRDADDGLAPRDFALIATVGCCGLRSIEAQRIRVSDCERVESDGVIKIHTAKRKCSDPDKMPVHEVTIPEPGRSALRGWLAAIKASEPRRKVFGINTRAMRDIFKRRARAAGLKSCYSFHSLRHTRGVLLYAQTKDAKLVQRALRHVSGQSTDVYIHVVDAHERESKPMVDL